MAVPMREAVKVGAYVAKQRLRKNDKFAVVLQLEPLYMCNLACAGCGKIQHTDEILQRRLTVQQCIDAVEECGAPMVSIAGGEPLVHKEIDKIVQALVDRKRFVYLCTNAILLEKKLDLFTPSPYFSFSVHIDGLRERHDESVCRDGVFDKAVKAIKEAKRRGFRVTTNTTFFDLDNANSIREVLDFLNDDLGVDTMQISPGYAYEKAPDRSTGSASSAPGGSSARRSPTVAARSGGSTTRRCSSTSWRARSTSAAPPGAFPRTRCWAGRSRAISWATVT